jgi:hypothetical protein
MEALKLQGGALVWTCCACRAGQVHAKPARMAKRYVIEAPGLHHFDIVAKCADFAHPIGQALRALTSGR